MLAAVAVIGILAVLIGSFAGNSRVAANRVKCLSNERQIGLGLLSYAADNGGIFPPTTHTTGSLHKEQSWIYGLAEYLGDIDGVRVCPADPPARQKKVFSMGATSYALNDLVFDSAEFNRPTNIPRPSATLVLAILSENRAPSTTRDHIHGAEWTSFSAALSDIEADRHRNGARSPDRLKGSSNYLYADGSARNIPAADFKALFAGGNNPAEVPER